MNAAESPAEAPPRGPHRDGAPPRPGQRRLPGASSASPESHAPPPEGGASGRSSPPGQRPAARSPLAAGRAPDRTRRASPPRDSSRAGRIAPGHDAALGPRGRGAALALAAGATLWLAAPPARAQLGLRLGEHAITLDRFIAPDVPGYDVAPGVTVASRERPLYDPLGVRVGGFVIRPVLEETVGYSSNVTGTRDARGSPIIRTDAAVRAQSDWSRHSLGASFTLGDVRTPARSSLSFTDWTISAGGTYDIGRDTVSLAATHQNLNQTPRDLDTAQLDRTIAYRVDNVRLGYRAVFNRLSLQPGLDVTRYDFDDGTAGGQPYPQGYRNRVVVSPAVTAAYQVAPRRDLVFVLRDASAFYTDRPPGTPRRDFDDVSALAGVAFDAGAIRYRLLVGYQVRVFASAQYKTIQAPVVEAAAVWTPTGLTTVTGSVARRIQDSADETTAAFTGTGVQLAVDHEYLRNVLLRATAGVTLAEYGRGQGDQTLYAAGASATWLLDRNLRLGAGYNFFNRRSSGRGSLGLGQGFGSSYTEHRALLQFRLAL